MTGYVSRESATYQEGWGMRHVRIGLIFLLPLLSPTSTVRASDGKVDPAIEAIRRETEARRRQQEQAFARLRALPAPPMQQARALNRDLIAWRLREDPEESDDADENRPKRERVVVLEETFDQVVYGSTGDADSGRAYLEKILERKIAELAQVRRPTDAQKKRLLLAGRGDVKRLFDRVEEERKQFQRFRDDLDRCAEFLAGLRPLQLDLRRGPFEFDSIYAKTLKKMLDDGELARRVPAP